MTYHCGECGSKLLAIGHLLFCLRGSCSMYDRAVTAEEVEANAKAEESAQEAA